MSDGRQQVKILQEKVQKTIEKMMLLYNENKDLKEQVLRYKDRIEELEVLVDDYQEEQSKIQESILDTLNNIESLDEALGKDEYIEEAPSEEENRDDQNENNS